MILRRNLSEKAAQTFLNTKAIFKSVCESFFLKVSRWLNQNINVRNFVLSALRMLNAEN